MLRKLKSVILNIDDILAGISVSLIVLITVIAVFARYVIGKPIQWTEEVSLGLFVWFIMLGASSAMKINANISIDILVDLLPLRFRKYINIFVAVISFVTLSFIIVSGFLLAKQAGLKITPLLAVPYTYIDIAIPVGGIMMLFHLIRRIKSEINKN